MNYARKLERKKNNIENTCANIENETGVIDAIKTFHIHSLCWKEKLKVGGIR